MNVLVLLKKILSSAQVEVHLIGGAYSGDTSRAVPGRR
jgi:hypothetical protein